ncbi:unnamed protein product [Amoebophrya sp. A120]|nr:unnamed protein product [Amoebophrya sp. A120]|eukprot:GSA120T00003838001.1
MPKRKPGRGPFVRIPQYAKKEIQELRKKQKARAEREEQRLREEYPSDYEDEETKNDDNKNSSAANEINDNSSVLDDEKDANGEEQVTTLERTLATSKNPDVRKAVKDFVEMGKQRRKTFERLQKKENFFVKSEKSVEKLLKITGKDGVEHAVGNCFDEMKLRREFPDQGVGHKYFSSGKFEIKYVLSTEGIPVCLVVKRPKV